MLFQQYDFIITDNGGNTTTLHAEVGNVDTARPTVDFHFEPLDGGDPVSYTHLAGGAHPPRCADSGDRSLPGDRQPPLHELRAVSYTHLKDTSRLETQKHRELQLTVFLGITAVSYTHLQREEPYQVLTSDAYLRD